MTAALDLGPESNLTRQRAPLADRKDDFYETPACATAVLLRVEAITGPIWEPCCGRGAIAKVLRANGFDVWATELREEAYADTARVDFLMERQTWIGSIVPIHPSSWPINSCGTRCCCVRRCTCCCDSLSSRASAAPIFSIPVG
jgi:hypothetical protein